MNTKDDIKTFDPNGIGLKNNNLFGLPFACENANIIIIPVPWDVTTSYHDGTSKAPKAILKASTQVELFDPDIKEAWKTGIAMDSISEHWSKKNKQFRAKAKKIIRDMEDGLAIEKNRKLSSARKKINEESNKLNDWLFESASDYLKQKKMVGVLGGDHSCPFGLIKALSDLKDPFGILQIDAHADLRNAYEGFEYSHASIMYNALQLKGVNKLVQVGIRDYCESEAKMISSSKGRIKTFYDRQIKDARFQGKTWKQQCEEIIHELPENIYISFDIDGLDPKYCPNTGTPVPGGLQYDEVTHLIEQIVHSRKKIIGFDLCEVSPGKNDWDANVGARLLYKLCNLMALSQNN